MEDFDTSFSVREIIKDKLRQNFDGKIVRKDLTKKIKEGANVPTYSEEMELQLKEEKLLDIHGCARDD